MMLGRGEAWDPVADHVGAGGAAEAAAHDLVARPFGSVAQRERRPVDGIGQELEKPRAHDAEAYRVVSGEAAANPRRSKMRAYAPTWSPTIRSAEW